MYNHKKIEQKWQKDWEEKELYKTGEDKGKEKYYVLDMFPYPSGAGLHVGHPKGYIATDILSRMKMMQGYNVLHPMGWDAFGLPAENFAIKNKTHPRKMNEKNIATFKNQLKKIGFTYDWDREINTTDPEFYKWTQWTFLQMFKKGLAYESHEPINWCPNCQTGLANEDLEGGKCERCGSEIEQKPMRQWVLKITDYADRLLKDLDKLPDWEDSIKEMQRNWIGKSSGVVIKFLIQNSSQKNATSLEVFTTRPDTLFGCTFMVIAPEHPLIDNLKDKIENYDEIKKYQEQAKKKTEMERTELNKEKTGVQVKGIMAINPVNNEEIPIFVADYVMMGYGTGAIMAVPAHDERDYAFASQKNAEQTQNDAEIKIRPVVLKKDNKVRSVLMGIKNITENDLKKIGVEIVEKKKDRYHVFIPLDKIEEYKELIREKMENHFWNEFYTGKNFYFIFKHKDGRIEEFELNSETNNQIDVYGMTFNDEEPKEEPENVYNWLAKNDFYKELFLSAEEGIAINSDFLDGLPTKEAKEKMIEWLEEKELGKRATNYKLKDWVFSRQRYWGEPIPVVHCEKCGVVAVPEKDLPVTLPEVESYEPTGTGESPLANIDEWVNTTCPKCGGHAKRETNTMPQWAGSSWYYLRYIDPHNDNALVDKEKEKYWSPVDFYVGGAEHATRHLIYARFWHKFLYDIGVVNYEEPFTKLRHVGLIMAEDGRKMSKRWGNVINPDDIVEEYGADAMRVYEMFMGPFSQACAWSTNGLIGARKFIEKIIALFEKVSDEKSDEEVQKELHKTIKKVSQDIDEFKFNTAIAQMMILVNKMTSAKKINKEDYKLFLQILAPFAPHISEELWQKAGEEKSIFLSAWPKYDENLVKDEKINLIIQVNGKLRDKIMVDAEIGEEEVKEMALSREKIKKWTEGKKILKTIFVKGRLLNIVVV